MGLGAESLRGLLRLPRQVGGRRDRRTGRRARTVLYRSSDDCRLRPWRVRHAVRRSVGVPALRAAVPASADHAPARPRSSRRGDGAQLRRLLRPVQRAAHRSGGVARLPAASLLPRPDAVAWSQLRSAERTSAPHCPADVPPRRRAPAAGRRADLPHPRRAARHRRRLRVGDRRDTDPARAQPVLPQLRAS